MSEEFLQLQDNLESVNYDGLHPMLEIMKDTLLQIQTANIKVTFDVLKNVGAIVLEACNFYQQNLVDLFAGPSFQNLIALLKDLSFAPEFYVDNPVEFYKDEVIETFSNAVEAALPFVPEESKSVCCDIIENTTTTFQHRHFTLQDILALLSFLIALLGFIVGFLPDNQLTRLIEQNEMNISQNEAIIHQNETIIDLLEEQNQPTQCDADLLITLNTLTESIQSLQSKVEELEENETSETDNTERYANELPAEEPTVTEPETTPNRIPS